MAKRKPTLDEAFVFAQFDEDVRLGTFEMFRGDLRLMFEKRYSSFGFDTERIQELFKVWQANEKYSQFRFVRSDFFEKEFVSIEPKEHWPVIYYKSADMEFPNE